MQCRLEEFNRACADLPAFRQCIREEMLLLEDGEAATSLDDATLPDHRQMTAALCEARRCVAI